MTQPNNLAKTSHHPSALSNNSVLVSIIIPAYNTASYIHRAIQSSLNQTYANIEILIIDDGSTDNTLSIARSFAEKGKRIRVFAQENSGVSVARNKGITEARGDYILFLDSDDWFENDAVETMLDAQAKHPDKLICSNAYIAAVNETGLTRRLLNSVHIQSQALSRKKAVENFCHLGTLNSFQVAWGKFFRACYGIDFPCGIAYSEDGVFTFKYLLRVDGAFYISKPLVNILAREESATRSSYRPEMLKSHIDASELIMKYAENTPDASELLQILPCYRAMLMLSSLGWSFTGNSYAEIKKAKEAMKPYLRYCLKNPRIGRKRKLELLCRVYLPTLITKSFRSLKTGIKKVLKKLKPVMKVRDMLRRRKISDERIENWKDFPSQP